MYMNNFENTQQVKNNFDIYVRENINNLEKLTWVDKQYLRDIVTSMIIIQHNCNQLNLEYDASMIILMISMFEKYKKIVEKQE